MQKIPAQSIKILDNCPVYMTRSGRVVQFRFIELVPSIVVRKIITGANENPSFEILPQEKEENFMILYIQSFKKNQKFLFHLLRQM